MTNKWQKVYISDRPQWAGPTPQLDGEVSGQVLDTGHHHHQTPQMSRRILLHSQLLYQDITTCTNQPANRGVRNSNLWPKATNAVTRVTVLPVPVCFRVAQKMKGPWDLRQAKPQLCIEPSKTEVLLSWKRILLHQSSKLCWYDRPQVSPSFSFSVNLKPSTCICIISIRFCLFGNGCTRESFKVRKI